MSVKSLIVEGCGVAASVGFYMWSSDWGIKTASAFAALGCIGTAFKEAQGLASRVATSIDQCKRIYKSFKESPVAWVASNVITGSACVALSHPNNWVKAGACAFGLAAGGVLSVLGYKALNEAPSVDVNQNPLDIGFRCPVAIEYFSFISVAAAFHASKFSTNYIYQHSDKFSGNEESIANLEIAESDKRYSYDPVRSFEELLLSKYGFNSSGTPLNENQLNAVQLECRKALLDTLPEKLSHRDLKDKDGNIVIPSNVIVQKLIEIRGALIRAQRSGSSTVRFASSSSDASSYVSSSQSAPASNLLPPRPHHS